ncbi:hypothetical protein CVT26_007334 [Gymnopilus dilepis]|uniref:Myosin-binding domain-containing protein n=1 Tax=Gymnopilus dilepis TaxID=231916 RepID=A0A409VP59_9AGAR|nr:hypothetical protein CVT26_007334 [Gymnopilus dilepis]
MAQALFDEHPLEEYLRDAGESPLTIPGICTQVEREIDPYFDIYYEETPEEVEVEWRPQLLIELVEFDTHQISVYFSSSILQAFLSTHSTPASSSFVEKFKYNVISSSLLAPSLPTSHSGRSLRTLSIPGKLNHSRTSSLDLSSTVPASAFSSDPSYGPISFSIASLAVFFSIGYPFFSMLSLFATLFLLYHFFYMTETSKHDMTSSFNALDDLIAANEMWESVVQDAVTFLDSEERSSSGSSSPSPIRVALHSCLQTTHTQCDNIRQLFAALTSPSNLSQLSEMYAPPSPMALGFSPEMISRPFSFPSPRLPSSQLPRPTTPENKRSTWNGSYASLAGAGSPPSTLFRRRDEKKANHRMHLSDVFRLAPTSAPVTPLPLSPGTPLPEVPENSISLSEGLPSSSTSPIPSHFGAAALDLQRRRKTGGLEVFRAPSPSYFTQDMRAPRSARNSAFASTISSSSKFTSPQPSRHPLSYAALTSSLQGALAAKRYTCSHLLALRFTDDEDDGYWEDVRSVIGLLTSTLTDSFSRLAEALDEAEQEKLRAQNPTPDIDLSRSPERDCVPGISDSESQGTRRRSSSKVSFAPVPSQFSRFAAHVAAISSALEDARDDLEQCVAALRSETPYTTPSSASRKLRHSRSFSKPGGPGADEEPEAEEPRAVQAYERLRRELGLALRECERGRERLLELVHPPPIPSDDDEDFDDLPSLGHDGSDDSDKPDPVYPSEDEGEFSPNVGPRSQPSVVNTDAVEGAPIDDATSHLLLTTSSLHLPMPGVDEVFEAETGPKTSFTRERSKLSREERIKLAKARRESGKGLAIGGTGTGEDDGSVQRGVEKWGPGGDVVQELKDVIWKVSERKRMLAESTTPPQPQLAQLDSQPRSVDIKNSPPTSLPTILESS